MKGMINKRVFAVLMAIALFLTYAPGLSYALTEDLGDGGNAEEANEMVASEAAEAVTVPEAETETEETDKQLKEPENFAREEASAEEPEPVVADDSVSIDDLVCGLESSESQDDQVEFVTFESKAALLEDENTGKIGPNDYRIYGNSRYKTSQDIADRIIADKTEEKFENIIVAYGKNFPDALSGGYLAKVKNAPILLVEPSQEPGVIDYITRNIASGGKVYILGGTGVVSSAFEKEVKAKGIKTKRLWGSSRYETNLAILDEAEVTDQELLVCTAEGYADSLSASAVGKPILLVGDALTEKQKTFLNGLSKKQVYLIGGNGAVIPAVEDGLKAMKFKTKRLWGPSRYETSAAVAKEFFAETDTVVLAYAKNFPDGLSGGPLAMMKNAPILLTDSNNTTAAREYVVSAGAFKSYTLGGPTLISNTAVKRIMSFFKVLDKYATINNVGGTAVIKTESNYGTEYSIENSDIVSFVSKKTSTDEKGMRTETLKFEGNKSGTTVIKFNDKYSDLIAKPVVINVGELSVQNLHDIIEMTGYKNRNKDIAVEPSVSDKYTRVFFVNHSNSVELVCAVQRSNISTYTSVIIPLEESNSYQTRVIIESAEDKDVYTDVSPSECTESTKIDADESVNSAFITSMDTWNAVLGDNYGMEMKNLGFTQY